MITAGCGSLVRAPGPLLGQRVARVVVAGVVLELVLCSAPSVSQSVFRITEKASVIVQLHRLIDLRH